MERENMSVNSLSTMGLLMTISSIHLDASNMKTGRNMKAILKKEKRMARVSIHGQMGRTIRDSIKTI